MFLYIAKRFKLAFKSVKHNITIWKKGKLGPFLAPYFSFFNFKLKIKWPKFRPPLTDKAANKQKSTAKQTKSSRKNVAEYLHN